MNNLIQTIIDYTTALEQKLSALEARVAQLEEANEAMRREGDEAKALVATLQAEVAALAATGAVATQAAEPEVEIELIVEEETESENEEVTTENEFAEEPAEKQQEEVQAELETLDIIDTPEVEELVVEEPVVAPAPAPQPEVKAEPVVEPIVEPAPQPEVKAEPVVEPAPAPQPAPRSMPQQTSLFGAAVEDIRQAISLGDRFLFQRELFAGNGELMQKTLDEINNLGSLNEAMDYVLDNFDWDKESTAVQLFENVLKRRFS